MLRERGKIVFTAILLHSALTFGEILLSSNVEGPVCPGTELKYLCESDDSTAAYTLWGVPYGECNASNLPDSILLIRTSYFNLCAKSNGTCGRFTATNTMSSNKTFCTSSLLTLVASVDMNGKVIQCSTYAFELLSLINATIRIESIPQPPNVTLVADLNGITVLPHSSGTIPNTFVITVFNDDGQPIRSLETNEQPTSIALSSNTNYTFSVSAVNCVGKSIPTLSSKCTIAAPPLSSEIQAFFTSNHLNVTWKDEGRCITQYWIRVDDDDGATIRQELVVCTSSCFYGPLIKETSNYYLVYISSVTPSGIGPESEQIKTQPLFEVIISEITKKSARLECINRQPDISIYKCYICCSDRTNNQVSNFSLNTGENTTVLLTPLLDAETYTCIAVSTDVSVTPCENGSLKGYLRYRFTIDVIVIEEVTPKATQVPPVYTIPLAILLGLVVLIATVAVVIGIIIRKRKMTYHRLPSYFQNLGENEWSVQSDLMPLSDATDIQYNSRVDAD